ncbi:MAG: hypothetical protein RR705_07910 [Lachnospiraceae bacterium]
MSEEKVMSVALKNGEWIEKAHVGRKLTFDEIANKVGMQIAMN